MEGENLPVSAPRFIRIGNKLIGRQKIDREIDRILGLRAQGLSQQQVARQVGTDRTFVSRLESLGEIRKGRRIALVGFPVRNKQELEAVAAEEGLEFVLLMTDTERWDYVASRSGSDLVQEVMQLISAVRGHDALIFIGSDQRVKLAEALAPGEFVALEIGTSPITEDKFVDPEKLRRIIRSLRGGGRSCR